MLFILSLSQNGLDKPRIFCLRYLFISLSFLRNMSSWQATASYYLRIGKSYHEALRETLKDWQEDFECNEFSIQWTFLEHPYISAKEMMKKRDRYCEKRTKLQDALISIRLQLLDY